MRLLREHKFLFLFLVLLVLASVMIVLRINAGQSRHVELREAFILLHTKGYRKEAEVLYKRLLVELQELPDSAVIDDFQRTLLLVDPTKPGRENLIWVYHWTVSNELERRSESTLQRALKLADETK